MAGIGMGRLLGEEHASTPRVGWRLLACETEPLQIVLLFWSRAERQVVYQVTWESRLPAARPPPSPRRLTAVSDRGLKKNSSLATP